jgi:hypothetical protein
MRHDQRGWWRLQGAGQLVRADDATALAKLLARCRDPALG